MSGNSQNVRVQDAAFDPGAELNAFLARNPNSGGVASFIGQMRDFRSKDSAEKIAAMTLEHYPGMAEKQFEELIADARQRWTLDDTLIIHRYGTMHPGDPIVLVLTASAHRADALAACEFLIDWLKTKAPFWKKEMTGGDAAWVESKDSDDARAERWQKT